MAAHGSMDHEEGVTCAGPPRLRIRLLGESVINGRDSALLGSTRSITRRMSGALSAACGFDVTVQAVLVLVGAAAMQTLSRPAEVHVRTQHDLRDWLCKQPVRLGEPTIAAIADPVQAPSHAAALLVE